MTAAEKRERRIVRHSIHNAVRKQGRSRLHARKFIDRVVKEAVASLKPHA